MAGSFSSEGKDPDRARRWSEQIRSTVFGDAEGREQSFKDLSLSVSVRQLENVMKRMLLLKASTDVCATEVEHIQKICEMFCIQHCVRELQGLEQFKALVEQEGKFDFLYLGAHADVFGFGEADGSTGYDWEEFGATLCTAGCLQTEAVLLLGCCRGGLQMVAMKLFHSCPKIDYVTGPRWTVTPQDITTAFHVFLYNMVVRHEQPSTAAARASAATGYDFYYYDRVESDDRVFTAVMEDELKAQFTRKN